VSLRLEHIDRLTDEHIAAIAALRDEITASSGSSPLSDHAMLALHDTGSDLRHTVAWTADGALAGYSQLAADGGAELATGAGIDPGPLLDDLVAAAGRGLTVWARGEHSSLAAELPRRGFTVRRELVQMRRPLTTPLDEPAWPAGVTVRAFVVGQDEAAWLRVNNAAFAGHPDQSDWSLADLRAREAEPWFSPDGFFLAERGGELVGFHWTKVHGARGPRAESIGEIYVIGVAPEMQGQRLGAALALHGMRHLRSVGMTSVMLYVEATSAGAIGLYERLGFHTFDLDRCFKPS
jgi:mycothiol synthase